MENMEKYGKTMGKYGKTNMKLVLRISEDGSEMNKMAKSLVF